MIAASLVIPAYNEVLRIGPTLEAVLAVARDLGAEVVVVDDGSTDGTAELLSSFRRDHPEVRVVRHLRNRGKGAAVRSGVAAARGSRIAFMDADLATDLADLPALLGALDTAHVAIGSRAFPGSITDDAPLHRVHMGRAFNRLVRELTDLSLLDTQCGFKAFRGAEGRLLFDLSRQEGFAFDVEVLALAHRIGYRVREVPVSWRAVAGSHVRPVQDALAMSMGVLSTRLRLRSNDVVTAVHAERVDGRLDDGTGLEVLRHAVAGAGPVVALERGLVALLPFVAPRAASSLARQFTISLPDYLARAGSVRADVILGGRMPLRRALALD